MRNLLMLLVAVLGTSAMVQAFPAKAKATPAKEVTMKKHHKHNKAKKEQKAVTTPEASSAKAKK